MGRVIFWTTVTVLFFSLLEAAILSNLAFLPVMPDLVMLAIVYVSFMNSSSVGIWAPFGHSRLSIFPLMIEYIWT